MYEEYPRWGGPYWNIPSGRIEDHETPFEGACRELAEETGLVVATADLVLHGTAAVTGAVTVSRVWNFTVDVVDPTLHVRDPDGLIQEARWFPVEEASRLLHELPYRPLSEPSVAVLTRQAQPGAHLGVFRSGSGAGCHLPQRVKDICHVAVLLMTKTPRDLARPRRRAPRTDYSVFASRTVLDLCRLPDLPRSARPRRPDLSRRVRLQSVPGR
ncbi:NUDIX hydrolase [Micromonospora soli]|uniref:NUDIX hydrolase n=1 Tax=Micromonospora sp. NBRC 110009 TaxID=3061627 RepID=UPI0026713975|nr:NUDIX hydrolase [Micromonospora sp. NBRC 110009]WKT97565.1 NUDIX hydrolase [Micromonospora sp. NBRC 110009]